jgi:hypothetical protein
LISCDFCHDLPLCAPHHGFAAEAGIGYAEAWDNSILMSARILFLSRTLFLTSIVSLGIHDNALAQDYDRVTAEIPADQAAIRSVALAKLNIARRSARLHAQQTLCQDHWSPGGKTIQASGPEPTTNATGQPVWHYQSLRQPHPLACTGVSRTRFFLEMSRHLPEWVTIRPAGYTVVFRPGDIESTHPDSLASR